MNPLLPEDVQRDLVLASKSPRRFDILSGLGFEFEVDPPGDEVEDGEDHDDPAALAELLAEKKCAVVAARRPDSLVLAADTVVILDGELLEKPTDDEEAARFLSRLSGRTHTVVTGVAIERRRDTVKVSGRESTRVTFRDLGRREIEAYVATGEGRDKAGSYAAQGLGAGLIRSIDGCFYNVVGLPVSLLMDLLRRVHES
jgi:septum formation protein